VKDYVIGIDLGGTNIECGLVDREGEVVFRRTVRTDRQGGGQQVLSQIISMGKAAVHEGKRREHKILAAGVGTPGAVDRDTGCVLGGAENIPGWKGIPLVPALAEALELPVFASNDVTLYALAEAKFGAGRGKKHILCLAIGTGIGGGLVINGKLYRGARDGAGEIGHMTVKFDGGKCACGSYGCLESYASATAIAKAAREAVKGNRTGAINSLSQGNPEEITAKVVFEAARRGDKTAQDIVKKAGRILGAGIANAINLLNPEIVILGGGVAGAGKMLLDSVEYGLQTYGLEINRAHVQIALAELGSEAGVIGAASLAWQEVSK